MDQLTPPINPNTANRGQLTSLKGIGPALADRIIAMRPFQNPSQLLEVSGIGPSLLETLEPQLTLNTTVPDSPEAEKPSPAAGAAESPSRSSTPSEETGLQEYVENSTAAASPSAAEGETPEQVFSRSQTIWLVSLASLLSFILALALTLGLLSGLNSGLRYPTVSQQTLLQEELRGLSREVDQLEDNLGDLRTRVDNLASVQDRVSALEEDYVQLSESLDQMSAALEEVQSRSTTFQTFLENLRQNLNELLPDQE